MPDDITPGELSRSVDLIRSEIRAGFAEIKTDLNNYVLKSVHESEMKRIEAAIKDLESDLSDQQTRQRWVAGTLTTAVVGLAGVAIALWNTISPHIT